MSVRRQSVEVARLEVLIKACSNADGGCSDGRSLSPGTERGGP